MVSLILSSLLRQGVAACFLYRVKLVWVLHITIWQSKLKGQVLHLRFPHLSSFPCSFRTAFLACFCITLGECNREEELRMSICFSFPLYKLVEVNEKEVPVKHKIIMSVLLAVSVAFFCGACPFFSGNVEAKESKGHPDLSEQEQLIPCSQCHKAETPDLHDQWYNSRHGIGMVKCYQCHGTFENLVAIPDRSTCGFCHNAALEKCPSDKPCWECHPAHKFELKQ